MDFKLRRAKVILPADLADKPLNTFVVEPKFNGDRMFISHEGFWPPWGEFRPRESDPRVPCALLPKGVVLEGVLTAEKFIAFDCLMSQGQDDTSWTWGARRSGLIQALMEAADPKPTRGLSRRKFAPHVHWPDPSPSYSGEIYGVRGVLESAHCRAGAGWEALLAEVLSAGGSGVILKTGLDTYHTEEWLEVNALPG
jgi:hypothetical protein